MLQIPVGFFKPKPASGNVGVIISDNFNRGSLGANWTIVGTPNASIVSNKLQMTGNNAFTDWIEWDGNDFLSEYWTLECDVSVASLGHALGIGMHSISGSDAGNSWEAWLSLNASPTNWNLLVGSSVEASGSATLTYTVGDIVHLKFQRTKNDLTATATNLNDLSTATVTYSGMNVGGFGAQGVYSPGSANPYLLAIGTTVMTVDNFTLSENITTPLPYLIYGDSISSGLNATTTANRWAGMLGVTTVVCAVVGGVVLNAEQSLPETALYQSQKALLMVGGNNTWDATAISKYTNIVNTLVSNGTTVIHLLPTPRNSGDPSTLRSYLISTYPTSYIDTYTPLYGGGSPNLSATYDSGDGVHPNNAGHALIASTITSSPLF